MAAPQYGAEHRRVRKALIALLAATVHWSRTRLLGLAWTFMLPADIR
jgi:hypothetical protein